MLNLTNYQGNENQNHHEISPHICQSGYYQKNKKLKLKNIGDYVEKRNTCIICENVNWFNPYGKHYVGSSKS